MKFCNTCIYWEGGILNRAGKYFGICHEPVAQTKMIQDTSTSVHDESIVYTEKYFGCIHHRSKACTLISINEIVKDQLK